MTLILKQLFAFVKLLNSDTGTNQLASGLAIGIILGFSPFLSIQVLISLVILLFFRIQIGAAFISSFFFKFVAFLIDPLSDQLGRKILESESFRPTWTFLYDLPIIPLTRFNNSIVMGSGLIAITLTIPAFYFFRYLVIKYREKILANFKETKFWKAVKATAFYKWYATYDSLYGSR